jgi:hypothetical protein
MASLEDLYDTYTRAASTPELDHRVALLRECAIEGLEIASPFPYSVKGINAVAKKLGEVAAAMPEGKLSLRRTGPVDAHNDFFRVMYENRNDAGERISTGLHVVELSGGKIARIIVFVPAATPSY